MRFRLLAAAVIFFHAGMQSYADEHDDFVYESALECAAIIGDQDDALLEEMYELAEWTRRQSKEELSIAWEAALKAAPPRNLDIEYCRTLFDIYLGG